MNRTTLFKISLSLIVAPLLSIFTAPVAIASLSNTQTVGLEQEIVGTRSNSILIADRDDDYRDRRREIRERRREIQREMRRLRREERQFNRRYPRDRYYRVRDYDRYRGGRNYDRRYRDRDYYPSPWR
jgi:lipopolysaccharide export LptBFGC system permease protein LptF